MNAPLLTWLAHRFLHGPMVLAPSGWPPAAVLKCMVLPTAPDRRHLCWGCRGAQRAPAIAQSCLLASRGREWGNEHVKKHFLHSCWALRVSFLFGCERCKIQPSRMVIQRENGNTLLTLLPNSMCWFFFFFQNSSTASSDQDCRSVSLYWWGKVFYRNRNKINENASK